MNQVISQALIRMLKPLIRVLLKNNIPYSAFSEIAKWVYVDVASKHFALPGKKQSVSRVAIITGLSRKETARIKDQPADSSIGDPDRSHRAIRVISGWQKDPLFIDNKGKPKVLSLDQGKASFSELVKKYSGDIPHMAILNEMVRAGVVGYSDDKIILISEGYIVTEDEMEKMNILGVDTGEFISTIAHNMAETNGDSFFQRKVSYDNIPEDYMPELREQLNKLGKKYIEDVDKLISEHDRDINPEVRGEGRKKAGLGIFYFE